MSKTYRRKSGEHEDWFLRNSCNELEDVLELDGVERITISHYGWHRLTYDFYYSKDSKYGKKELAKYHSDSYRACKEPGPMWFIREFAQVPYRQHARMELIKFSKDFDYEVVLRSKPHRTYWT